MPILMPVVAGLVVAAVLAAARWMKKSWKRHKGQGRPVRVVAERVVREPWGMVLKNGLPSEAASFETAQPHSSEVNAWLRQHGAVDYCETMLRLFVTGESEDPVLLNRMTIEAARTEAHYRTRVQCPTAGARSALMLIFDLDEEQPEAWEWEDQAGPRARVGSAPYFQRHHITLARDETEQFIVIVKTVRWHASWRLRLELAVRGRPVSLLLDDDGAPYETAGDPDGGFQTKLHWAWYEQPQRFAVEPELGL